MLNINADPSGSHVIIFDGARLLPASCDTCIMHVYMMISCMLNSGAKGKTLAVF